MSKLAEAWTLGGLSPWELLKRVGREVVRDDVAGRAAQSAFYAMLALVPLLVMVIGLLGTLPSRGWIEQVLAATDQALPAEVAGTIAEQIRDIRQRTVPSWLSLTAVLTLWAASGAYSSLASCLNAVYDVEESRPFWRTTLVALGMTVVLAALLVIGAGLVLAGTELTAWAAGWLDLGTTGAAVVTTVKWLLVLTVISLALALLYFTGPDVDQSWQWITPGSVLGTVLWVGLSLGFRVYVANFANYNATYGALGGVIILLLWLYLSSAAILIGGEVNAVIEHASRSGKAKGSKVQRSDVPAGASS